MTLPDGQSRLEYRYYNNNPTLLTYLEFNYSLPFINYYLYKLCRFDYITLTTFICNVLDGNVLACCSGLCAPSNVPEFVVCSWDQYFSSLNIGPWRPIFYVRCIAISLNVAFSNLGDCQVQPWPTYKVAFAWLILYKNLKFSS